jgi:hypothetical protein
MNTFSIVSLHNAPAVLIFLLPLFTELSINSPPYLPYPTPISAAALAKRSAQASQS